MTLDQQAGTGMTLTKAAADKALALLANEGDDTLALRISVAPGGCAGMRYELALDEHRFDGDISEEFYGVKLVTDQQSAPYLLGATIDFVDTIQQQGFTIDNPNVESSCACGNSFH
jgi:iron-sulfur cluster assembly accessory protein